MDRGAASGSAALSAAQARTAREALEAKRKAALLAQRRPYTASSSVRAYISLTVSLAPPTLSRTLVSEPESVPAAPSHLLPLLLTSALVTVPPESV